MKESRNKYEIFLVVAELKSITEAAHVLSYTQSGISHSIASLEKEMGFSLFERSNTGVILTENGRKLVNPIMELVNQQRKVSELINDLNNTVAGTLRLGTFSSITSEWVPQIIEQFTEEYPNVVIELHEGRYDEIGEWVRQGRIDCGFLTAPEPNDMTFTPLKKDPLIVLVSQIHPLTVKKSVSVEDLLKYPLILPIHGEDHDIQDLFNDCASEMDIRYALRDDKSIISMVERNLGITIMPELATKWYHHSLIQLAIRPAYFRLIGISSRKLSSLSIVTRTFIEWMSQHVDKF